MVQAGRARLRDALRRSPRLQLLAVAPRYPDQEGGPAVLSGHAQAQGTGTVLDAGGDRVQIVDVEQRDGTPIYVHAKVCVVDDVWATVGSDNFNRRSWTHDSELTAAVLDAERDGREPADPAGLEDGARRFARELRLELMREHLEAVDGEDLLDPDRAADAVRRSAAALDRCRRGRHGPASAGAPAQPPAPRPAADVAPVARGARVLPRARSRRPPVAAQVAPPPLSGLRARITAVWRHPREVRADGRMTSGSA